MHNDTKAMDFNRKAKVSISERDSIDGWPCCVYCGAAAPAPLAWSNAHFIARSQGGLGIPENGLMIKIPFLRSLMPLFWKPPALVS